MASGIIGCFLINTYQIEPIFYHHEAKEHGIDSKIKNQILQDNIDLLIIPDAGSNNLEECKYLYENSNQKICIIILDHHEVEQDNPYAYVVNHHIGKNLNTALSGAGVTDKFVEAYCLEYNLPIPYYNDMVAVSLISDICDVTSLENRYYLEFGLNISDEDSEDIEAKYICNLMLDKMFKSLAKGNTTPTDISWNLAPKINALCRGTNQEAKETFFRALVGLEDVEQGLKVAKKAHSEQTKIVKEIYAEIEPTIDNSHNVIISFIDNKYKNYSGLIANKVMGNYHKPVLILREDEKDKLHYSGSMRSPSIKASEINKTGLASCSGHEEACGVYMLKENLNELIEYFDSLDLNVETVIPVTAILKPEKITTRLCNMCQKNNKLWAKGLEKPLFYLKVKINSKDVVFFKKKTNTMKFVVDDVAFLKFRVNQEIIDLIEENPNSIFEIEMLVNLEVNEWNNTFSPQGIIDELEIRKISSNAKPSIDDDEDRF